MRTQTWPGVSCCQMLLFHCWVTSSTATKRCGLFSPTSRALCGRGPTSTRRPSARSLKRFFRWLSWKFSRAWIKCSQGWKMSHSFVPLFCLYLQDALYNSQTAKLRFMKAMHSIAKVTGKAVATAFDLSSFKTACDLGGKQRMSEVSRGVLER